MPPELDKDALETLTPEERAAIEDSEYSPEELEAMKAVAGDDGDDDDDDDDDGAGTGDGSDQVAAQAEAKPAAPAAADASPAADQPAADATGDDEPLQAFKPRYQAQLPEDFTDQVAAINQAASDLAQRYKDGDLDFEAYQVEHHKLLSQRDSLNAAALKAQIATEMSQQTAQQEWEFTVKKFVRDTARAEKIDYSKDADKQRDLDLFVKTLAQDARNNDKDMEWFLAEAHKRVKALHGLGTAEPNPQPNPAPADKGSRKPPIDAAPKTLAHVPGSDGPGDLAGEFADIDQLDGDRLEEALRRMTPAQRERYASLA